MARVDCVYYNDFGWCEHPKMKKILWVFKRECSMLRSEKKCPLQEVHSLSPMKRVSNDSSIRC